MQNDRVKYIRNNLKPFSVSDSFPEKLADKMSIHEEYLQGETIYAGKLDTLKIRPGFYRAQLEGQTQFLGNSNQVIVEYEDQVDIYPLESGTINDGIFSLILPNLDEKSYEFSITTFCKFEPVKTAF